MTEELHCDWLKNVQKLEISIALSYNRTKKVDVLHRALYMGELRKKYDIYRNNNKKTGIFGKFETVSTIFFYAVNFFHSLVKLNSSLI